MKEMARKGRRLASSSSVAYLGSVTEGRLGKGLSGHLLL